MMRRDELDPLPYTAAIPSLMSATGRVDVHTLAAKFLADSRLRGPYLEFGVGKGRSAVSALRAYTREGVCDHFVLCDSFQGLPPLQGPDAGSAQFSPGDYAFSQADVAAFLHEYEADALARVTYVPGWFGAGTRDAVAAALEQQPIALLHVDVDLYESCRWVLEAATPWLRPGVVVLFDDWNCFNASNRFGERRAVAEWLQEHPDFTLNEFTSYGWHGRAFIFDR